ncbi:N6-adenosine-specific RNA methylase IME4 [Bradyrhizobium sp. S3.14.4]
MAAMDAGAFEHALERHADEMRSGAGRVAMDLLKVDAEERGRVHRRDLASALSSASALTPSGRQYPAGYGDPPWKRKAGIGNRAYENHYPTMSWPAILDYLKIAGEALLPDSWFWMWIPRAHLLAKVPFKTEAVLSDGEVVMATVDMPLAWACMLALGMDSYSTCYVWTKTDAEHPDESGTGLLVWDQDELLLQFKRGRGLPKPAGDEKFGSNHRERPREHSRKPDHYRDMIAAMVGKDTAGQPLPVLELFARVDAEHPLPENWGAWGNQAGVSLTADVAPAAGPSSPDDLREAFNAARAARDAERLWEHPARDGHTVSMTRGLSRRRLLQRRDLPVRLVVSRRDEAFRTRARRCSRRALARNHRAA